jgi:hypothetical protein
MGAAYAPRFALHFVLRVPLRFALGFLLMRDDVLIAALSRVTPSSSKKVSVKSRSQSHKDCTAF